jgi:hypothetical protein
MSSSETYRIEYRDTRGRWHRQRGGYDLAGAATSAARDQHETWRVVDAAGNTVAQGDRLLDERAAWARIEDGYLKGDARITDNGAGIGPARGSGRWAVEIAGRWIANVDTLDEAKALAGDR